MSDGTKVSGKNFPTPAIIDGRVCLVLEVPDALEYRAAMYGQIEWLADWRCWKHDETDYADPPQVNRDIAAMFAEMVATATWEECMDFCERMAQCFIDQNEVLINALADALRTNETLQLAVADALTAQGGGVPGVPLSDAEADENSLPENVFSGDDCDPDALWGAVLYLVQSGNRAITDFFEVLEVASNTLENMEIVSKAIPAAGDYISAAAGFADQLQEVIAEGYAGAYTETFEEALACDIFCAARSGCELTPEMLVSIMNARLSAPLDLADFGEIMAGIATGTWVGDDIANVAFLVFFGALRFGQQFGDTVGIRPLTILMSLGADQLASDNWIALCDCPEFWDSHLDTTSSDYGFVLSSIGAWTDDVGFTDTFQQTGNGYRGLNIGLALSTPARILSATLTFTMTPGTLDATGDSTAAVYNEVATFIIQVNAPTVPVSPLEGTGDYIFNAINVQLLCGVKSGTGDPTKPPQLPSKMTRPCEQRQTGKQRPGQMEQEG